MNGMLEFTWLFQNPNIPIQQFIQAATEGSAEALTVSWGLERMNLSENTTS